MDHPLHSSVPMGHVLPLRQRPEVGSMRVLDMEEPNQSTAGKTDWDTELFLRKAFQENVDQGISSLFRHYYAILCSHAVRYVSSKAIAEDIVSDIFYEFQAESRYQTITTSYRAYLFTAVRNRAFDYVRAEMRHNTSLDNAALMPAHKTQSPDTITQYEELYHDVEKAINNMPLKRRQIYVMHRFEGKKYQEIANELNLSLRTVEAHLFQAIRQIRDTLKDKWLLLICLFEQFGS